MSANIPCRCSGTREEKSKNWVIRQYKENRSAFNGYHPTPSDYSAIHCTKCLAGWRTKARYVQDLPMEDRP